MSIDLGQNSLTNKQAPTLKKPPYLIVLDNGIIGKTRQFENFLALDKPESVNGFIQVKGFFVEEDEEKIAKSYANILFNTPKESQMEMMFPLHRIFYIKSLVFNAVKNITPINNIERE